MTEIFGMQIDPWKLEEARYNQNAILNSKKQWQAM